jgi:hypothetical protein
MLIGDALDAAVTATVGFASALTKTSGIVTTMDPKNVEGLYAEKGAQVPLKTTVPTPADVNVPLIAAVDMGRGAPVASVIVTKLASGKFAKLFPAFTPMAPCTAKLGLTMQYCH